jgi:hypothetical protein
MSMIIIPPELRGKNLSNFLIKNKKELIQQKKNVLKWTEPVSFDTVIMQIAKQSSEKAAGSPIEQAPGYGQLNVKVVANAAWWCDSQMDVLTDKSYDRSVMQRGPMIPHIADHNWKSTAHVGDVKKVYTQLIPLTELGLTQNGKTTALIFETLVKEDYNAETYKFYKNGKINQHSIGLQYFAIDLAINDPDCEKEIDFWNKYIDKIINKDYVSEIGYFWLISDIKVMENSCVLFGANALTPTLEMDEEHKSTQPDPAETTQDDPLKINFGSLIFN